MPKAIIIILIIWLAIGLMSAFLLVPFIQGCFNLQRDNLSLQQQITEFEALIPDIERIKSDYELHKDRADKVRTALPGGEEIPELLSEVMALSSKNGLLITGLGFSIGGQVSSASSALQGAESSASAPTITEANRSVDSNLPEAATSGAATPLLHSVTLDLSLMGFYGALKTFLQDMEQDLRILDLRTLSLSPNQKETLSEGASLYAFDLTLETYFLPQKR